MASQKDLLVNIAPNVFSDAGVNAGDFRLRLLFSNTGLSFRLFCSRWRVCNDARRGKEYAYGRSVVRVPAQRTSPPRSPSRSTVPQVVPIATSEEMMPLSFRRILGQHGTRAGIPPGAGLYNSQCYLLAGAKCRFCAYVIGSTPISVVRIPHHGDGNKQYFFRPMRSPILPKTKAPIILAI